MFYGYAQVSTLDQDLIDVLAGYVRRVDLLKDHAGAGFL